MAELIPWWNLLPQAQTQEQSVNAALLGEKLRQSRQQNQGYNAVGQLFANPANTQNGMLNQNAIAQLMQVSPQVGMSLLGQQSELQARQAQIGASVSKVRDEHHKWLMESVAEPAVAEYESVLQKTGSTDSANMAAQKVYSDGLNAAKADGRLSPQEAATLQPNFDYNRARVNVLGLKGIADLRNKEEETIDRRTRLSNEAQKVDLDKAKAAMPQFVGEMDDGKGGKQQVTFGYGPGGPVDPAGKPVDASKLTNIRKIGASSMAFGQALSPEAVKQIADQYLAGDKSALQGLGYGATGAANRAAVRDELATRGVPGAEIATAIAEFGGTQAAERTLGTRQANLGIALNEAKVFLPMGVDASNKVNRTQFPTLNAVIQAYDKGTGDEDIVRLAVATNAISNAYAQVAARGGQSTDAARAQAHEILNTAYSKGQYATAADQMMKEILAAQAAPRAVRQELRQGITGQQQPGQQAASSAAPAASADIPPAGGGGVTTLRAGHEAEDWAKVPSGARYRLPDGREGTKP